MFGQGKKCGSEKKFESEKNLGQKKIWSEKKFGSGKKFESEKNLGQWVEKKIWVGNFFWIGKKNWGGNFFWVGFFFCMYHLVRFK